MRPRNPLSIAAILLTLQVFHVAAGQGLTVSVGDATFQPETNGGVGLLSFPATLDGPPPQGDQQAPGIPAGTQVTLIWSTGDQTARGGTNNCGPGVDYLAQSQVALTLSSSQPVGQVSVPICGDSRDEANETFNVLLSVSAGSATLTRNVVTGTIVDDDPAPTISVGAAERLEGNSGTAIMVLPVTLSTASGRQVSASFQTEVNGLTATQAANCAGGADLQPTSGQVNIAEGLTGGEISVPICGDAVPEAHQTFRARLTGATNASVPSNPSGIGTILNDDATFGAPDAAVTEPTIGTRTARLAVNLSSASLHEVRVSYRAVDGTARSVGVGTGPWTCPMIDYMAPIGVLTFPPKTVQRFVDITVCGDRGTEGSEYFYLDLSNPIGTTIAVPRATITIRNASVPTLPRL